MKCCGSLFSSDCDYDFHMYKSCNCNLSYISAPNFVRVNMNNSGSNVLLLLCRYSGWGGKLDLVLCAGCGI